MSNTIKLPDYNSVETLNDTDILLVNQNGQNKKVTKEKLLEDVNTEIGGINTQLNERMKDILSITRNIQGKNIKLIGDSIMEGFGTSDYSSTGDTIYDSHNINVGVKCFSNKLKLYLENTFACTVKNYGIGGLTSQDIVLHKEDLIKSTDDIIICMIGTNNRNLDDGIKLLKQDIVTIYNYVKSLRKEIIFMSSIPATVSNNALKKSSMEQVENAIMDTTSNLNIEYISLYKMFVEYIENKKFLLTELLPDGLHPNDQGHEILYYLTTSSLGFSLANSLELNKVLFDGLAYLNSAVINLSDSLTKYSELDVIININGFEIKKINISNMTNTTAIRTFNLADNGSSTAIQFLELNLNKISDTALSIVGNYCLLKDISGVYTKKEAIEDSNSSEFIKIIKIIGRR